MTAAEILNTFPRKSALVVGDICLDRWCTYDSAFTEPSRETGIPRLAVVSSELTPGAGGTIANNLAALGVGRIGLVGAIGNDGFGHELMGALTARGISTEFMVQSNEICTFTYMKILNIRTGIEDQGRLDFINPRPLPPSIERVLVERLREFASEFDVIFVADQAETQMGGIVTGAIRAQLEEIAGSQPAKLVWIDSRVRSELFHGVILKPNQDEADAASRRLLGCVDYSGLRRTLNARLLFVTQGPVGVLVVNEKGETLVPTRGVAEPVDICGAGDSFSAGAGIALSITGSPLEAARFGNLVASITIMKKGTGTASPAEVLRAAGE